MLLAHGRVKQLSKQKYADLKLRVGMALNVEWAEPMHNSREPSGGWGRGLGAAQAAAPYQGCGGRFEGRAWWGR